jgi:glutaredoxin-like protein
MIRDRDRRKIAEMLKGLAHPVKNAYFTQEFECEFCRETGQLLKELSDISDKIALETYNFQLDREAVERFGIDKIPATVVMGDKDYGIRLYGVPAGYEFTGLVETIMDVGRADSGLQTATREKLRSVTKPIHLQVMVTPT